MVTFPSLSLSLSLSLPLPIILGCMPLCVLSNKPRHYCVSSHRIAIVFLTHLAALRHLRRKRTDHVTHLTPNMRDYDIGL
jgi:hypothetical protein